MRIAVSPRSALWRLGFSRRNLELLLVLAGLGIGWLALFTVQQAMERPDSVAQSTLLTVVVAALFGHLAIRFLAAAADPFIFPVALLLNLLGLVMIHRLDLTEELRTASDETFAPTAPGQATWFAVGIGLFAIVLLLLRDHRQLQRYTFTSMVLGIVMLLLPLVPLLGVTLNGARLWIRIGSLSFQPAEAAKILLPVFFAGYLARRRLNMLAISHRWLGIGIPRLRDVGPILVAWAISLLVLISQRDLGTSLLFFGLFVGLLYMATGQRTWLALGALLFTAGASAAYLLFSHVKLRVSVWLDPFAYAHDEGYQLAQALYGFASGGIFGRGLGQGFSWLVPYAKSDFILTSFGEELGYAGLAALLLLYAIIIQRILRLSLIARDEFGKLLSMGLALVLALQVFVVLGGVSRLIPLTGLTAPFLAAGGSALVANWVMVALLLRISSTTAALNLPAGGAA